MKKLVCIALSALALAGAVSCNKYDDSELRSQISGLDKRVTALEGLNSTVSGLQTAVSNLQKNVSVTSVTTSGGVTTIVFSDGSKAEISSGKDGEDGTTPVIAVKQVDGVYVWTINGEVVKDADGNPLPVADLNAPQFRVSGEGALEYSVDGGKTWQAVAAADPTAGITVSETDTNVTITFADGSSIVLAKDVPFTLKFSVEGPVALAAGQSADFPYEVIGATGAVDVDVLSVSEGLSAGIEAKTATTGTVTVTNVNAAEGTSKVFVYAADHNGKSDIVSLHFTVGGGEEPGPGPEPEVVFEAALDAELIPAEGGEFVLNVSADEDYTVSVSAGAKEWLSVSAPTRALYEDDLVVTVAKNETTGQRSGTITLSSKVSDKVIAVDVLQEAGEEPAVDDPYLAVTGYYSVEAKGRHREWANNKWTVRNTTVKYDAVIMPAEDSEEYYVAALLEEEEGETYPYYFFIDRDAETGELSLVTAQLDEWEHSSYGTIEDWQYGYIFYSNSIYTITGDYPIGYADAPKDGVFKFESAGSLSISTGSAEIEADLIGMTLAYDLVDYVDENGQGGYSGIYMDVPFPATFTKTAELPEEEAAPARLRQRGAVKAHAFAPERLQLFSAK